MHTDFSEEIDILDLPEGQDSPEDLLLARQFEGSDLIEC